jgi:foldase protein PrsA
MKINFRPKITLPKFNKKKKGKARKQLPALIKIKAFFLAIVNFFRQEKVKRVLGISIVSIAVVVFLFELTFAGLIYIGKKDTDLVKKVAKIIPYPMVLVNFNPVTVKDYNFEAAYIEHFYTQSQREIPAGIGDQIVDQLITNKILETKAPSYGVKISDSDIDSTINDLVSQSGGQAEVEKVLTSYYGLSLTDFRVLVKDQLLQMKMKDTVPVQVKASHILIKVDKAADQATVDAAKAKADGLYKQLVAGADFATLAKANSDDTGSRDQGGDLGWFARGDMVKQFEDKAFSMKPGDLSEPIRTDYGWHIIKVTDRKGFEDMSFDDWVASVRSKAFIKQLVKF